MAPWRNWLQSLSTKEYHPLPIKICKNKNGSYAYLERKFDSIRQIFCLVVIAFPLETPIWEWSPLWYCTNTLKNPDISTGTHTLMVLPGTYSSLYHQWVSPNHCYDLQDNIYTKDTFVTTVWYVQHVCVKEAAGWGRHLLLVQDKWPLKTVWGVWVPFDWQNGILDISMVRNVNLYFWFHIKSVMCIDQNCDSCTGRASRQEEFYFYR